MKNKILILFLILSLLLLNWCNKNQENEIPKSTNQKISINNKVEKQIKIKEIKEENVKKFIIYVPRNCKDYCQNIIEILFKDKKDIIIKNNTPLINATYPLLETNKQGLKLFLKLFFNLNNIPDKDELKKLGFIIKDNKYYLPIGFYNIKMENFCNDNIDNDQDGLIDEKDPDCQKLLVYYDSKATYPYDLTSIKNFVKTNFAIWFKPYYIDYQKNKQIYTDITTLLTQKVYLPIFLITDLSNYGDNYKDFYMKLLKQINYLKNDKDKSDLYKYIFYLKNKGWDPQKEKVILGIISKEGKLNQKTYNELIQDWYVVKFNGKKYNLVIFTAGKCPFCRMLFKDIKNNLKDLKNRINNLIIIDYPLPQLHWNIDNDIAIVTHCLYQKDKNNILNKIFDINLNDNFKKYLKEVQICYNKNYSKIKNEIYNKIKKYEEIFNIKWTPTIIVIDNDLNYKVINWYYWYYILKTLFR